MAIPHPRLAYFPLRGTLPKTADTRKSAQRMLGTSLASYRRTRLINIRISGNSDQESIRSVYWSAFPEEEREIIAKLAVDLFSKETTPRTISLVAETEGVVVGHIVFSPVVIGDDNEFRGYILAPLAVKPPRQKRGVGSKLIEAGMQQLAEMGVDILFVYGDPAYYRRFGFGVDTAECYIPPYKLQYPFGWQAIALSESPSRKSDIKMACVTALSNPALW